MIICIAANPSIDKLFEVERLVPGAIHRPARFVQTAGGKGLNVARAAHSLGADVRAVGILRGHGGTWLVEAMKVVSDIEGISFVYFDDRDVVRHKLVQQIVKAYEAFSNGSGGNGAHRPSTSSGR